MEDRTVRQRMAEVMRTGLLSAKDLSKAVGIREKDVASHLDHIARSIQASKTARLVVKPSECVKCGYVFRKRDKLKTPSRCAVCRSEEITETRFGIEDL